MTNARDDLMRRLSDALTGRQVRWAQHIVGDYEGRDRTLEVFNADPAEQGDLYRRLRPLRREMEALAGGPVIVIFHTRSESARLYSHFVEQALLAEVTVDVHLAERELDVAAPTLGIDVVLHPRGGIRERGARLCLERRPNAPDRTARRFSGRSARRQRVSVSSRLLCLAARTR